MLLRPQACNWQSQSQLTGCLSLALSWEADPGCHYKTYVLCKVPVGWCPHAERAVGNTVHQLQLLSVNADQRELLLPGCCWLQGVCLASERHESPTWPSNVDAFTSMHAS